MERTEYWIRPGQGKVIALLHGIGAKDPQAYWQDFLAVLMQDETLSEFGIFVWQYPTHVQPGGPRNALSALKRRTLRETAPRIALLGSAWNTTYQAQFKGYQDVVLVCHSMGGLVVKSWILNTLEQGQSASLATLRHIAFYATPHQGAPVTTLARWNRQLQDMQLDSPFIEDVDRRWYDHVVAWKERLPGPEDARFNRFIPHLVLAGLKDAVVPSRCATIHGMPLTTIIGDHSQVIHPIDSNDTCYRAWRTHLDEVFKTTPPMTTVLLPPHASTGGRASLYDQIRDYTNTIEEKTRDFVGREFVFDEVKHFIKAHQSGYFFIEGDPGIGKTALAAQMVKTYKYVHHFNIRGEGIDDAEQFLSNICAQLIVAYHLEYSSLPPHTTHDAGFLNRLLSEIASKLGSTDNVVIVVDALDEVDTRNLPPGTNPLYLPLTLPQGIFIIVTTRRGVIPRIEHEPHILKLNTDDERNKADIRAYIEQHVGQLGIQTYITNHQIDDTSFIRRLEEKSEGNFMYLRYVLRDIEKGAYRDTRLENLPRGLENYYEDHWKRMGMMATPLPHSKIVIIYIIAEIRQAASLRFIADCAKGVSIDALTVQQVLIEWDQFLRNELVKGEYRYSIYHTSFRDFLYRKETVQAVSISLPDINDFIAQSLLEKLGLE